MATDAPEEPVKHSSSRTRPVYSRPTTPLRPSSRSSLRRSPHNSGYSHGSFTFNVLEPAFSELSDAMADLEANMMHFQLMHESLARFSESFASFLYGLNMNAFCVDFPEGPISDSFHRHREHHPQYQATPRIENDIEATFMTTDTSFIENPLPAVTTPKSRQSRLPYATRVASSIGRKTSRGRDSGLTRSRGRGGRSAGELER